MLRRSGQAMAEFAIIAFSIAIAVAATVEFLPLFLDNVSLLKEVREEAGAAAVTSGAGVLRSDRRDEFSIDIPGIDSRLTSGHLAEKILMPAANLAAGSQVSVPAMPFAAKPRPVVFRNTNGTSAFSSGIVKRDPGDALALAIGAMTAAGWTQHKIGTDDAALFYTGDERAPDAVAAVHSGFASDGSGFACVTIIARTAGAPITP